MVEKKRTWMRPALFTMAGVIVGYLYYYFIGCASGTCAITSNPWISMIYVGLVGWLLSGSCRKECDSTCNTQ